MVFAITFLTAQLAWGNYDPKPGVFANPLSGKMGKLEVDQLLDSMKRGTYGMDMTPGTKKRLDVSDIPFLLERADSTSPVKSIPMNPISSFAQAKCSEGMVALWLVEGIRRGSQIPSFNVLCLETKSSVSGQEMDAKSESHHAVVAAAYRAWWKKGHSDPAATFKVDPLAGTGLSWQ